MPFEYRRFLAKKTLEPTHAYIVQVATQQTWDIEGDDAFVDLKPSHPLYSIIEFLLPCNSPQELALAIAVATHNKVYDDKFLLRGVERITTDTIIE